MTHSNLVKPIRGSESFGTETSAKDLMVYSGFGGLDVVCDEKPLFSPLRTVQILQMHNAAIFV